MKPLTPREQEVWDCICSGFSPKEIATQLRIEPETLKIHTNHLRQKLGIPRGQSALMFAVRTGAVKVPKSGEKA